MDVEENVDDFLKKVKQLDLQRQHEDELRRKKLEDDIQSYKSREFNNISIPNPVARDEGDYSLKNKGSIPHSDSLQNFNKSVSSQYRLDVDHLVYESAYNYEKSKKFNSGPNNENIEPSAFSKSQPLSHFKQDNGSNLSASTGSFPSLDANETFRASIGSISREKTYKKYDDIPNIIRFDDTLTKSTPNYKTSSRYINFRITDEEKKSVDSTIDGLVGGNHRITEVNEPEDEEQHILIAKPLTRDRKGGAGTGSLAPAPGLTLTQSNGWSNAARQKPSLETPSSSLSQLKRSPRKAELSIVSPLKPTTSEMTSPIKKSPAKLDFSKYTSSSVSAKPSPPPKPSSLRDNNNSDVIIRNSWLDTAAKNGSTQQLQNSTSRIYLNEEPRPTSWLDSASKKSTSTPQWQDTAPNMQLGKQSKTNSWLDSATKKSSSTPQWQDTTPKIHLSNSESKQASWLDSAMKNTPHKEFELPKSKIKPVVPSKSNTLAKMMEDDENSKEKQHMTLKELGSRKLNHINTPKEKPVISPKKSSPELAYSPQILKKTRSSSPTKKQNQNGEEHAFLEQILAYAPASSSQRSSEVITAEALAHKSKLKPALPTRKPSIEVPEALKKAGKLKPPLPKRKPSLKVPEALMQKRQLKQAAQQEKLEEPTPEALSQKNQLKPALPKRKPSVKESEALELLNRMKSKTKGPAPITKPKPRVFSNSKELLRNQLGSLKSTKEVQAEPKDSSALQNEQTSVNLEKILRRAQTDSALKPVRLPFMTQESDIPLSPVHKASTFDNADLESDKPKKKLEHLTKKRARGPKRRAPKKL